MIASLEKKARTKYNQNTMLQTKGWIIKINITYGKEGWSSSHTALENSLNMVKENDRDEIACTSFV